MRACLMVIAAVLTVSGPAFAESPKTQAAPSAQPQQHPAEVVLAATETVRASAPASAQPNPAPAKRRVARITTCRCGDPQVDAETQER